MQKIEIQVPNVQNTITMRSLKLGEASALVGSLNPKQPFANIKKILKAVSNSDAFTFRELSFQESISLMLFYRMNFFNDELLSEKPKLSPSDFFGEYPQFEKDNLLVTLKSDKYGLIRFNPYISLDSAVEAEKKAIIAGDVDKLALYIMGAGCIHDDGVNESIDVGVDTILSLDYNSDTIKQLNMYNVLISQVSNVRLSVFEDIKSISEIHVVSREEAGSYAMTFRGSKLSTL